MTAVRNMATGGDLSRIPGFLERVAREYGSVASWRMPRARFWFFDEPALIEQILTAGAEKARAIASDTLVDVRRAMGVGTVRDRQ